MHPSRVAVLLTLFAALVPATAARSEVPVGFAFAYDGYLANPDGTAANGVFDFRFILYDAPAGGNQIGNINYKHDIVVSDGHFFVKLNFGPAFNGSKRWLEVA